jgi:hypothetical protein
MFLLQRDYNTFNKIAGGTQDAKGWESLEQDTKY